MSLRTRSLTRITLPSELWYVFHSFFIVTNTPAYLHQSFKFGTRLITATGGPADHSHLNVLRLVVHRSTLDRAIRLLFSLFPKAVHSFFRSVVPEWFLPEKIVLKKRKDGWDEEFQTEQATYQKLRCLQGHVIPVFHGEVHLEGTPALLLSDVGGTSMAEPGGAKLRNGAILSESEFQRIARQALGALAACGIAHADLKLDNLRRVEDEKGENIIMIVDLEQVDEVESKDKQERIAEGDAKFLADRYRNYLEGLRYDGLLPESLVALLDNDKFERHYQ